MSADEPYATATATAASRLHARRQATVDARLWRFVSVRFLVAVSVVGALMVALAAAESKRPSQNMSRRPWDAVILLGVLAVFVADLPGWVGFVVAAGGLLAALARGLEAGSQGD